MTIETKVPEHLAEEALTLLLSALRGFGNKPGKGQTEALHRLCTAYTQMMRGELHGKHAFPLATGFGKSLSVRCWLTAAYQGGHLGKSVAVTVACTRVEALCELKRELIASGIPTDKIGLLHEYVYKQDVAETAIRTNSSPPERYATEPKDLDALSRPIVLLSQNRMVYGKREQFDDLTTYRGRQRLIIWDESCIGSEASVVGLKDLDARRSYLETYRDDAPYGGDMLLAAFSSATHEIKEEADNQRAGKKPQALCLLELAEEQYEVCLADLKYIEKADKTCDMEPVRQLLGLMGRGRMVRVVVAENAVAAYAVLVPSEANIIILDASAAIRELQSMDPSVKVASGIPPKRWDRVTAKQMTVAGGRDAIEGHFKASREKRWLSKSIADVIKNTEHGVLVFTYQKRRLDIATILKGDLEHHGVDLETPVATPQGPRPKVNFATWGQECGDNKNAHCRTVILLGIYRRSRPDIAGAILAQLDSITADITSSRVTSVWSNEVAHAAFQALSRGNCRQVEGDLAGQMEVYVLHKEVRLQEDLAPVTEGMSWSEWEKPAGVRLPGRPSIVPSLVDKVQNYLDGQKAERVSKRRVQQDVPEMGAVARDTRQKVWAGLRGWLDTGNNIVLTGA